MKQLCVIVLCMMNLSAFGASMCIPQRNEIAQVAINGNIAGNRGYFATGVGCINGTTTCRQVYYQGEAHCSASPVYPADNWESVGKYCYCRVTHVRAPNGYVAPFPGRWVMDGSYPYGTDYCMNHCTGYCWTAVGSTNNLRINMFLNVETE